MQPESDKKLYPQRLDRLYAKRGVTWEEIAADLGVGVAMLMMVRSGKRGLSAKSLYRLDQAERAAGIEKPPMQAPPPFFNPSSDPKVAQRAVDIFSGLDHDLSTLPRETRDKIHSHFLQLMMLMTERAAAPAQEYMKSLEQEVEQDRARERARRQS